MHYKMKDKRELSGDKHTIDELYHIRDRVSRFYEESIFVYGLEEDPKIEMLEDRLIDVCFTGIVGDFKLYPDEWNLIEEIMKNG